MKNNESNTKLIKLLQYLLFPILFLVVAGIIGPCSRQFARKIFSVSSNVSFKPLELAIGKSVVVGDFPCALTTLKEEETENVKRVYFGQCQELVIKIYITSIINAAYMEESFLADDTGPKRLIAKYKSSFKDSTDFRSSYEKRAIRINGKEVKTLRGYKILIDYPIEAQIGSNYKLVFWDGAYLWAIETFFANSKRNIEIANQILDSVYIKSLL